MFILYTRHAEEQIIERKVERVWIEETIKYPHITKRNENKYYVIRKLNGVSLKVVYVKEKYIKIITVFYIK